MSTAAIALAAVLAIAAVLWVARPFLRRGGEQDAGGAETEVSAERLRLLEARDRALAALKELEFDHRTGKVSTDDYRSLVRSLRGEAARALEELDAATAADPRGTTPAAEEERPR